MRKLIICGAFLALTLLTSCGKATMDGQPTDMPTSETPAQSEQLPDDNSDEPVREDLVPEDIRANEYMYLWDDGHVLSAESEKEVMVQNNTWSAAGEGRIAVAILNAGFDGNAPSTPTVFDIANQMGLTKIDALVVIDMAAEQCVMLHAQDGAKKDAVALRFALNGYNAEQINAAIQNLFFRAKNHVLIDDNEQMADKYIAVGKSVAAVFVQTLTELGYPVEESVTAYEDTYPNAKVSQTSNGAITFICFSGQPDQVHQFWNSQYQRCASADGETFIAADAQGNETVNCAVQNWVDGQFVCAQLIGNTCLVATTDNPDLTNAITNVFEFLGAPAVTWEAEPALDEEGAK